MFFSVGGLVTVMRRSIETEMKLEMARDIFIVLISFCLITLLLAIIVKFKCTNATKSYKV